MSQIKQYLIGLSLIVCVLSGASAQQTGLSVGLGGASFQMDDMKYLLETILESYPVEGAVISSFPPYYSGSVTLLRPIYPQLKLGAGYTYTTTGGKTNYTDYSGNINTDMTAVSHRLGLSAYYSLLGSDHLDLSLFGNIDANFTSLDISTVIYVLGFSNRIINKYRSISPNGSVGLEFLYKFKDASIGIDGAYLVDIPGHLKNKENETELTDPNDRRRVLTSDWTGWRFGIKGIIWISK